MESAPNLHHHQHQLQLQHQLVPPNSSSSSSSPLIPSCFGLASTHVWTPNISLNTCCSYNPTVFNNGMSSNPIRDSVQTNTNNNNNLPFSSSSSSSSFSPVNASSMVQDLGFQWNNNNVNSGIFFNDHQSSDDFHHEDDDDDDDEHRRRQAGKVKDQIMPSFTKFTEMLLSDNNNNNQSGHDKDLNVNNDDLSHTHKQLLIKTLISSEIFNGNHIKVGDYYNNGGFINSRNTRGGQAQGHHGQLQFSQIYPSVNVVSNWNNHDHHQDQLVSNTAPFSNTLDLNLQTPADMLATSAARSDDFSVFKDHHHHQNFIYNHHDQMQHQPNSLSVSGVIIPTKVTPFSASEVTEVKRACNSMDPRVNNETQPSKKTRLESRASCPPFKVRKEKLGDRIAALQQLVAPFGKTDTASVLMEAIGYIKFLQNQVETLSVPYMKPSSSKSSKTMHRSSVDDENEEPKRDLRGRGLCLVPLGCLSYVTGDGGGGGAIWPPPGYNPGTSS